MTYRELFQYCEAKLADLGIENFQQESNWILNQYSKISSSARMQKADETVDASIEKTVLQAIQLRSEGRPLAHIFGEWEFYGHPYFVTPDTLIPRPETETLVEAAIEHLKGRFERGSRKGSAASPRVLDVGAGTGCIGISIILAIPGATLTAVERSRAAAKILEKNILRHDLGDKAKVIAAAIEDVVVSPENPQAVDSFDLIVANPPYIAKQDISVELSVIHHEPHAALFADEDGLGDIRRWSNLLARRLSAEGAMGFEIGAKQGAAALEIFQSLGHFSSVKIIKDLSGHDRVVWGER